MGGEIGQVLLPVAFVPAAAPKLFGCAPEQIFGAHSVDGRADVYALGVILYELLSGQRPFQSDDAEKEMRLHLTCTLPSLARRAAGAPQALVRLITAMLAKQPAARPSLDEVDRQLGRLDEFTKLQETMEQRGTNKVKTVMEGQYRGPVYGNATVEWLRDGPHYQVRVEVSIPPLGGRRMLSDGQLGPGGLSPRRYDEETEVALRATQRQTVLFEPDRIQPAAAHRSPAPGQARRESGRHSHRARASVWWRTAE